MNKVWFLALLGALFSVELGYTQIRVPLASPEGSVSTVVGLTNVHVRYYRPKMKRRQIFGEGETFLVPYGKIWRTGANLGTTITFSDDVKVQGSPVPKGQYLIFSWPGAIEWAIALYKDLSIGGNTAAYDRSNEVISFKVRPTKLTEAVNTFTINISDVSESNEQAHVQLAWEHTSVSFSVDVDYDARVMSAIESTDMQANPDSYVTAARYYYDRKRHLDQALAWINKYLGMEGKGNEFPNLYLKAQIQRALYDKKGALITAKKALELAKRGGSGGAVYIGQIEGLIKTLK